jgi:multiple sugar transport system substrate-binding protein
MKIRDGLRMPVLTGITWNHDRGWPPLVACSQAFAESHPDVQIDWQARSLHDFGHAPVGPLAREFDLVVLDHPWIGSIAESGDYLPFDDWLASRTLDELHTHSVGPSHDSYTWQGRQWALAIDAATPCASYRPDILKQLQLPVPNDWEGVLELGHRLRQAGLWMAVPLGPVDAITAFLSLAANQGDEPFASGERVVDHAVGCRALQTLTSLLEFCPDDVFELTPITLMERMSCGDELVYCPLAYSYSNYSRAGYRPRLCRYANMPGYAGCGPRGSHLGGTGLAVSARCSHPDIAAEFAAAVASGAWQRSLYFDVGGQPAHAVAWDDPAVNETCHDFFAGTRRTIEQSFVRPRHNGYIDFQYAAGALITKCLRTGGDHDSLLSDLNALYRHTVRS